LFSSKAVSTEGHSCFSTSFLLGLARIQLGARRNASGMKKNRRSSESRTAPRNYGVRRGKATGALFSEFFYSSKSDRGRQIWCEAPNYGAKFAPTLIQDQLQIRSD
jgi:hypothetical protein